MKTPQGDYAVVCFKPQGELREEGHREAIDPDLLFERKSDFGVGWELHSDLFEKTYDHNVASGGHYKDAIFLLTGSRKENTRGRHKYTRHRPDGTGLIRGGLAPVQI